MASRLESVNKLRRSNANRVQTGVATPLPAYPWKTRLLLPGGILAATAALFAVAGYGLIAPAHTVSVAPVIQKGWSSATLGETVVQASGWIEPDPYSISVSALADGVVEDVLVLESAVVKKGDVLVRLVHEDARLDLEQAEASLKLAESEVASAQAELTAAQTYWDNPVELERAVTSLSAEAEKQRATLGQITSEITAETAIREEAERAYRRAELLWQQDEVGTEAGLDKEKARYEAQAAMLVAKREQYATVLATIDQIESDLNAAREDLRLRTDDIVRLEEAKASLQRASAAADLARSVRNEKLLQLDRMAVRAPANGVVLRRLVQPGAKVVRMMDSPHSSHVMHLYDPKSLQVRVDVPLVDAAQISVGQHAEITVEVLPDAVFQGEVTRVMHEADIQKNTLEVKVALRDPKPVLRPEMLARVRFLATATVAEAGERLAVLAPYAALTRGVNGTHVWVVENRRGDKGVARRRTIEPIYGPASATWIEVVSGLQPGNRLILNPPIDLRDGARVRIAPESQGR